MRDRVHAVSHYEGALAYFELQRFKLRKYLLRKNYLCVVRRWLEGDEISARSAMRKSK